MISVIDVTPIGQRRRVDASRVNDAVGAALLDFGFAPPPQQGENARYDSDGLVGGPDVLENYQQRCDSEALNLLSNRGWEPGPRLRALAEQRADSFPAGSGGFPRDFEFVRAGVIEEARQPLTASMLFAIDNSVPLGARTHSARRALGSGEAKIYKGGNEIPRAQTTYIREAFGTCFVVCAVETNFFEQLTTDFAGIQQFQQDLRLAFRLVDERVNRLLWFGDLASQIWGVLNYPGLPKMAVSTPFTDATPPEDVATALFDFMNKPMVSSAGTFYATDLAVSPKVWAFISSRPTTLAMNMFILQLFQAMMAGRLRSIEVAPELAGIGPNGEDGILAYRREPNTLAQVQIQAPTTLPVYQSSPLDQTTVVFASTGGMTAFDYGNCIIGYVVVP